MDWETVPAPPPQAGSGKYQPFYADLEARRGEWFRVGPFDCNGTPNGMRRTLERRHGVGALEYTTRGAPPALYGYFKLKESDV